METLAQIKKSIRGKKYHAKNRDILNLKHREHYKKNIDKNRFTRKKYQTGFVISYEDYCNLRNRQKNLCAICGEYEKITFNGVKRELAIDHCHKKGIIRGLLCSFCNTALGLVREDKEILLKMIDYIKKYE